MSFLIILLLIAAVIAVLVIRHRRQEESARHEVAMAALEERERLGVEVRGASYSDAVRDYLEPAVAEYAEAVRSYELASSLVDLSIGTSKFNAALSDQKEAGSVLLETYSRFAYRRRSNTDPLTPVEI